MSGGYLAQVLIDGLAECDPQQRGGGERGRRTRPGRVGVGAIRQLPGEEVVIDLNGEHAGTRGQRRPQCPIGLQREPRGGQFPGPAGVADPYGEADPGGDDVAGLALRPEPGGRRHRLVKGVPGGRFVEARQVPVDPSIAGALDSHPDPP
jgi:hypothetical protein